MNTKTAGGLMLASLLLLGASTANASPWAYFTAVTNLNPAGYWPMHEVETAPAGDIETNYGTLGALGNGYYNDWSPNWTNGGSSNQKIARQVPGPVVSPADTGTYFTNNVQRNAFGGYLLVPNVTPALNFKLPFTVEGWAEASYHNTTLCSMVGQAGGSGLNGNPNYGGWSMNWNTLAFGSSGTIFNFYSFYGSGSSLAGGMAGAPSTLAVSNTWYYFAYVITTNNSGQQVSYCVANAAATGPTTTTAGQALVPSTWSPLYIGNGRAGSTGPAGFSFDGALAEVAVYTNALSLSDLAGHYNAGTNASPMTNYFQLITNDNPVLYLRMNAPAYTAPASANWASLTNYGTVATNGLYTPGSVPGALTGSTASGYPYNVMTNQLTLLSSMGTFGDAGSNSLYNPTGSTATFSVSALFRGNPADPRVQSIVGHGTNSWQLGLTTSGTVVFNPGTNTAAATATGTAAGDLVSTATNDDGFWHYVVAVHNITTNFLYVDGVLVASNVSSASIPGNTYDVMIGADPSYTNANANLGRQFSGQICEVAFFTNALAASDVTTLYSDLGVAPVISQQPISASVNAGSVFTNNATVLGSGPITYQWYTNNVLFGGQTGASLILNPVVAGNASTNIYLIATNAYGSVTSAVVSLTVYSSPTFITQIPVTYTNLFALYAGVSPTFSLSASGAQPIYYQWYTNGVAAGGQTNTSFAMTNVQASFTNYCVATNFVGVSTSFVWAASVLPTNTLPTYPATVLALNPAGYWRLNESDDGSGDQYLVCHDYISGNDGLYTNAYLGQTDSYNPTGDPTDTSCNFGYWNNPNSAAIGIQNFDVSATNGANAEFTVEAWVNPQDAPSTTAGIAAKGYFHQEEFTLDCGAPTNSFRFEVHNVAGATFDANSTVSTASAIVRNQWYHLVGVCDEAGGVVSLYINGMLVGSVAITPGTGITNSSATPMWIGARAQNAGTGNDQQFLGYVNDVSVFHYALSATQVANEYASAGNSPPFFTQAPPTNMTVNGGSTLVITAAADGTPTLSNRWVNVNTSANVASGTTNGNSINATLTVSNVLGSWNGNTLELTVSNAFGITNAAVTLTVLTNTPVITMDLLSPVFLAPGQSYTYSIGVIGPTPYGYQWYNVTTPLLDETNSTYTVTAGSPGITTYYVVITNGYGPTTSSVSTLTVVAAPTNSFATNILGLNPVGYWPLQETTAPAPANMETNYGSLGRLGNAYYAVTNASLTSGNGVTFDDTPGALTSSGDNDPAAGFNGLNATTPTSYAYVPRLTPALDMNPPFTWEAWVNPNNNTFGDILAEGGGEGIPQYYSGNWAGLRLSWGGNFQVYADDGTVSGSFSSSFTSGSYPASQWHYCVLTFDGTNVILYVDGNTNAAGSMMTTLAIDYWTPFSIGAGRIQGTPPSAPTRGFNGLIDEVAVYTNILTGTQITNHWLSANTSGSNYMQTVTNDHPLLYYRMDNPVYTNPAPALYPVALNFGLSSVNGAYQPEVVPGGVSGPPITNALNEVAAPINGIFSCVDAGYDPAFNPTNTQPFTVMTWFKTYPSDDRVQTIMSHGLNWAMNLDGTTGRIVWNLNSAGNVTSTSNLNDGNWHFVAGVYSGSSSSLYVDGALNSSIVTTTNLTSDTNDDLYLGGNAAYTGVGGSERYFAGALAQAAFYTNALTATQVKQIYNAAVPPGLNTTPTNIVFSVTGNQLTLSWPADHIGWRLQSQTNSLSVGISTNWYDVSGSTGVDQEIININLNNGSVFYRLVYP